MSPLNRWTWQSRPCPAALARKLGEDSLASLGSRPAGGEGARVGWHAGWQVGWLAVASKASKQSDNTTMEWPTSGHGGFVWTLSTESLKNTVCAAGRIAQPKTWPRPESDRTNKRVSSSGQKGRFREGLGREGRSESGRKLEPTDTERLTEKKQWISACRCRMANTRARS